MAPQERLRVRNQYGLRGFIRWSCTKEAGVKAAGDGDVGGAMDEGTAVGEDSEGKGAAAEAEKKGVGADV